MQSVPSGTSEEKEDDLAIVLLSSPYCFLSSLPSDPFSSSFSAAVSRAALRRAVPRCTDEEDRKENKTHREKNLPSIPLGFCQKCCPILEHFKHWRGGEGSVFILSDTEKRRRQMGGIKISKDGKTTTVQFFVACFCISCIASCTLL